MNVIYVGTISFVFALVLQFSAAELAAWQFAFLTGILVISVALTMWRSGGDRLGNSLAVAVFAVSGFLTGIFAPPPAQEQLANCFYQEALVSGRVDLASVKKTEYGTNIVLRCDFIKTGDATTAYDGKLRIFTPTALPDYAGIITCKGTLTPLQNFYVPGSFDSALWNRVNNIGGVLKNAQVKKLDAEPDWRQYLEELSLKMRRQIESGAEKNGALLAGMTLGGSANIDDDARASFTANGLSHLLSVSGSHLVLLAGFLTLLLNPLPPGKRRLLILLFLAFYAALCGFKPPVLRALAMSAALLCGGRGVARGNVLCLTLTVLLIFNPLWLFDIGFQLSFGAAAGLLWLYPRCKAVLTEFLPVWCGEACAVTISAQAAVLPFLAGYFHQVSLISVISNVVLTPVLEFITVLGLAGAAFSMLLPGFGGAFLSAADYLLTQILVQADFLAQIPYGNIAVGSLPLWCAAVYYFCLLLCFDFIKFLHNQERLTLIAVCLVIVAGVWGWQEYRPQPLQAYFLDVGQGDAAVMITPQRKVIVIDTGGLKNFDTGDRLLVPFLYSRGITEIDALVLSHGDYDHAGGAASLAQKTQISALILPDAVYSDAQKKLLKNAAGARVLQPRQGETVVVGDMNLRIVSSPRGVKQGNEASLVIMAECDGSRMLFTGDIDEVRETALSAALDCDVLKVAHHGSKYSSSAAFLQRARPEIAVISAGQDNRYGHPHQETLQRLRGVGAQILRTDLLGTVKIVFDAQGMKWYSYKYDKSYF